MNFKVYLFFLNFSLISYISPNDKFLIVDYTKCETAPINKCMPRIQCLLGLSFRSYQNLRQRLIYYFFLYFLHIFFNMHMAILWVWGFHVWYYLYTFDQQTRFLGTLGGASHQEAVTRICKRIFTDHFAACLNWKGRGNKTGISSLLLSKVICSKYWYLPWNNEIQENS